jgi:hypothetical protein
MMMPEHLFEVPWAVNCPGGLILHVDWTSAGCTLDEDADGCRGLELRREGDPDRCFEWYPDGCDRCGIHL